MYLETCIWQKLSYNTQLELARRTVEAIEAVEAQELKNEKNCISRSSFGSNSSLSSNETVPVRQKIKVERKNLLKVVFSFFEQSKLITSKVSKCQVLPTASEV